MEKFSWQSDQGYRILIDHLQDGVVVVEEGVLVFANQRMASMIGYSTDELIGHPFIQFIAPGDAPLMQERYLARLAGETVPDQYDIHLVTAQGSLLFCTLNIGLYQDPNEKAVTIGSARDVTRQKTALAELEASKEELKKIFDRLPDVFYRTNMQGIITMISPSCFDILGYRQEVMQGTPMASYYVTPDDRQKAVQAITDGGGRATQVEAGLRHKDGSTVWISTNAIVRYGADGQPLFIEGVARDISEQKRLQDQLTLLSRTDDLTGEFSRSYFMNKSEEVIKIMKRYQRPATMMMLDLDHFKNINDNFGHHAGDIALIAFTRACRQEIRDSDVLGRLGGEEFGLMLPETTLENAQQLAERIRKATADIRIPQDGQIITITVSIGVVELRADDQSLTSILRRADRAMYQAKQNGRNQVVTLIEPV